MPLHIVERVELAAAPDAVWARFCDLSEWPRWFPALSAVSRVPAREGFVVGDALTLTLSMAGRRANILVRVESIEHHSVRWKGRSFGVTGDHSFYVEALGTGSRFTSDETFTGLPLRFVPRRYLEQLGVEARAGMQRFAELVGG